MGIAPLSCLAVCWSGMAQCKKSLLLTLATPHLVSLRKESSLPTLGNFQGPHPTSLCKESRVPTPHSWQWPGSSPHFTLQRVHSAKNHECLLPTFGNGQGLHRSSPRMQRRLLHPPLQEIGTHCFAFACSRSLKRKMLTSPQFRQDAKKTVAPSSARNRHPLLCICMFTLIETHNAEKQLCHK